MTELSASGVRELRSELVAFIHDLSPQEKRSMKIEELARKLVAPTTPQGERVLAERALIRIFFGS